MCSSDLMELWRALQLPHLQQTLSAASKKTEVECQYQKDGVLQRGRLTFLFADAAPDGRLHKVDKQFVDKYGPLFNGKTPKELQNSLYRVKKNKNHVIFKYIDKVEVKK